jgi:hypothetical protein
MQAISLLLLALGTSADGALPKSAEMFMVNDHKAFLYAAPKPAKGKPWVWYVFCLSRIWKNAPFGLA